MTNTISKKQGINILVAGALVAASAVATPILKTHSEKKIQALEQKIQSAHNQGQKSREKSEIELKEIEQEGQNQYMIMMKQSTQPLTYEFIDKLITRESTNNPKAISNKGARGLMQIMEPTWKEMTKELYGAERDYDQAFNPKTNREVGLAYLNKINTILTNSLEGYVQISPKEKQKKIAAAYNGGITRLLKLDGDITKMPKETRDYVSAITN